MLAALEIVVPDAELRIAPDAPPSAASADFWLQDLPKDQAARFVVLFVLPAVRDDELPAGSAIARRSLPNGRDVVLLATTAAVTPREATAMDAWRAAGEEAFYADLAAGRPATEHVGSGPRTFVGLHALPPVKHLVTILEFHAMSFYSLA